MSLSTCRQRQFKSQASEIQGWGCGFPVPGPGAGSTPDLHSGQWAPEQSSRAVPWGTFAAFHFKQNVVKTKQDHWAWSQDGSVTAGTACCRCPAEQVHGH